MSTADRESFAIRYCLPLESIAAEPQKLLYVNLRYAVSLKYAHDPSFDADHRDDPNAAVGEGSIAEGLRGDKESEPLTAEAAAALAEEKRVKDRERRRLYVRLLGGAGLLVLSAAVVMLGMSLYSMEFSSRDLRETLLPVVLGLVPFAMAFAGFLVLRLGTFRILSVDPDSATAYVIYNHRETDERIFEALVDSVSAKIWAYSLHDHPIVDSLRLARENYGDRLFIHPPFFVYSSALLRRIFKLPLPGYALLCQLLTLCLLPVLVYSVSGQMATEKPLSRFQQMTSGTALWAIASFSCCPIAAFCSQKIWIDNSLMFAVTLTVVAHTILVNIPRSVPAFSVNWNNAIMPHLQTTNGGADVDGTGLGRKNPKTLDTKLHQQQRARSLLLHFLSGLLFFGGIALNCKISALALVPFLFTWSLLQRVAYHLAMIGANLWAVVVWEVPLVPMSMLGGLGLWKKTPVLSLRVNEYNTSI